MEDSSVINAKSSGEQEATSTLTVADSKSMEWTDEKHCLFLKHMESTFVNQLYKSIDLYGWHSQENSQTRSRSSDPKPPNGHASSDQFKVLRDGRWSKIEFKRDDTKVDRGDESINASTKNPWIQHYRSPRKQQTAPSLVKASFRTTEDRYQAINIHLWSQDSIASNAEVSDQNFVEEAREDDKRESGVCQRTQLHLPLKE